MSQQNSVLPVFVAGNFYIGVDILELCTLQVG